MSASETPKHSPLPWRVGSWMGQCHVPEHVAVWRHPGPPDCKYDQTFQPMTDNYVGGIAGAEPGAMIVDTDYDSLVLSAADAEFIVKAVNSFDALLAALKGLVESLNDDLSDAQCAAWDQARDAIALAEGHSASGPVNDIR